MSWGRYVALVISRLFILFAVLIGVGMAITESGEHSGGVALLLVALGAYFIPWFVALGRKHHNTPAIFLLNLLLGWTLIGWVVAMVWAFTKSPTERREASVSSGASKQCPYCAEFDQNRGAGVPLLWA